MWVKRTDVAGTRYAELEDVDLEQTVDDFTARWVAQAKLDVRPSLVTLRLVQCGARKPEVGDEAKADVLDDPSLTLAAAGFTDGCSLLADVVQPALLAIERKETAERQRAERRARRGALTMQHLHSVLTFSCSTDVKVLVVSFPGERSDEIWEVCDQASLAALLHGGSLAPAATPSERLPSLVVLDSGAYTFVPPEDARDVPLLHNVTLAFDLMGEGTCKRPLTYRSISASRLDATLLLVGALGLAETEEDARTRRAVICEFADLRSGATYWLVPLSGNTLHSQVFV